MNKNEFDLELFAKRFSLALSESNENTHSLAKRLGLTPSTISRYCTASMKPKIPTVFQAADILNVNPQWLMGCNVSMENKNNNSKNLKLGSKLEKMISKISTQINEPYDVLVDMFLNSENTSKQKLTEENLLIFFCSMLGKNDVNYLPIITDDTVDFAVIGEVAAGFDKIAVEEWTGDKIQVPKSYLKGKKQSDFFVLKIKGNSMYPTYVNNDKVLVLKQNSIDYSGQVAVLIYGDDCGTIKKVEQQPSLINLVPINPQYEPIIIKEEDIENVHILGVPKLLIREI